MKALLAFIIPIALFLPMVAPHTMSATGGTITYSGGYTIHTFTTSGTFTPNGPGVVEYLVVAGGGGSSRGGGGAGGFKTNTGYSVISENMAVTVGAGGTAAINNATKGGTGSNSVFGTIIALGGGGGGASDTVGNAGGSGGGGGTSSSFNYTGGAGTPGQGNNGGAVGFITTPYPGGGGGGAGAVGQNGQSNSIAGNGGTGITSSISGFPVAYAGGGGGPTYAGGGTAGKGGVGGGGNGSSGYTGTAGTENSGGGGGGSGGSGGTGVGTAGGSGIVIIRYPTFGPPITTPFPTPTISAHIEASSFDINLDLSSISPTFALISTTLGYIDSITSSVNLTTTLPISLTISESNPLSLARGFAFILSDVIWLQILFGWFTTALLIILFITMARLVVAIWGIVERIISLIKLIPGI